MDTLFLVARLAGQRVALRASQIESVVEIETVTPVPLAPAHVAGLAPLRSRVLTVIDSDAALGLAAAPPKPGALLQAITVTLDNHLYGLIVEAVEDVVTGDGRVQPIRSSVGAHWDRVAEGIVELEGAAMLLVDATALIAGLPAIAA